MPQDHLDALAKAVFAEPDVLKPLESGLPPLDKTAPKKTTFEPDLSATQEILAKAGTTLSLERVQSAWLFLTCGRLPMPRSDADVQRVWEGDEAKDMKTLTAHEPDQLWFGSEDSWQEKDPREVFDAIQLKLALERAANIRLMRFELQDHLAATSEVEKELNRIATTPAQKVEAQNAISAARASAAAAQDLLRNHQSQTVTVKSADVGEESASTVPSSAPGFATSASGSAEGASTEANVPKYSIPINPGFSAWVRDTHSDAINRMTDRATFLQTSPHVLEEEREPKLEELNLEVNAFYERLQAEWLQFSSHTQDEWKRRARENQSQPGPNA
ncbi:Hypothetical Protein FCC1311_072282 [Hondaea fermentalgiana]|uniref:Uncharacterized protein n=1 Tax=Hondaea fermentalgiana TaxID=2315210 RepID=A0A2R5GJF1_9STRA|nr:Hypothetical Protein FCC1311_072282 [Hondaea fermentalgiana]|eukprot:GBG31007.1 Hypothetical Protein FCC1311_072282 [Hondaea fermentalgiana]